MKVGLGGGRAVTVDVGVGTGVGVGVGVGVGTDVAVGVGVAVGIGVGDGVGDGVGWQAIDNTITTKPTSSRKSTSRMALILTL